MSKDREGLPVGRADMEAREGAIHGFVRTTDMARKKKIKKIWSRFPQNAKGRPIPRHAPPQKNIANATKCSKG